MTPRRGKRKLAELGYRRSAKKCKEKFENVHKYYKRTKEGRAGRHDGKSYRFFSQLEALHSGGAATVSTPVPISFSAPVSAAGPSPARMQPLPISAVAPPPITAAQTNQHGISGSDATVAAVAGLSFSSDSSSSSSDSDDEGTENAGGSRDEGGRKRKRGSGGSRSGRKMMAFFEGLTKQVMERQEAMQQRFLETIEKREQDRMIREEAWRRQEVVRLNHEKEILAQERSIAANKDNALISYLQKITGQTIPVPTAPSVSTTLAPHVPPPPLQAQQRPQPHQQPPITVQPLQQHPPPPPPPQRQQQNHEAQPNHQSTDIERHQPSATELIGGAESQEAGGMVSFEPMSPSSRWPKAEVHALIKLRSGLESRYQEAGPKGALWEEISAGMQGLGYSRSAKRCKEKWENINKYFKKVKESNKNRPEDAKTCPYFHQLDALYRNKHLNNGGGGSSSGANTVGLPRQQEQEPNPSTNQQHEPAPQQTQQSPPAPEGENNGNHGGFGRSKSKTNGEISGAQAPNNNGDLPPSFFEEGTKKPEDTVKESMEQRHPQNMIGGYDKLDAAADSDNMDQLDDDCEDDDEAREMQYKIQFQRPNVNGDSGGMTMVK